MLAMGICLWAQPLTPLLSLNKKKGVYGVWLPGCPALAGRSGFVDHRYCGHLAFTIQRGPVETRCRRGGVALVWGALPPLNVLDRLS